MYDLQHPVETDFPTKNSYSAYWTLNHHPVLDSHQGITRMTFLDFSQRNVHTFFLDIILDPEYCIISPHENQPEIPLGSSINQWLSKKGLEVWSNSKLMVANWVFYNSVGFSEKCLEVWNSSKFMEANWVFATALDLAKKVLMFEATKNWW